MHQAGGEWFGGGANRHASEGEQAQDGQAPRAAWQCADSRGWADQVRFRVLLTGGEDGVGQEEADEDDAVDDANVASEWQAEGVDGGDAQEEKRQARVSAEVQDFDAAGAPGQY